MSSGGGSSSPTSTNEYTSNIPDYAQPYVLGNGTSSNPGLLPQAAALTNVNSNPYQQYSGQTVAGFSPLQNQAFSGVQGMQVAGQNNQASQMTGQAGQAAGTIASQAYQPYSQAAINQYSSPYTQDVINAQSNQAIAAYGQSLPQLGSVSAANGDLGSSREALLQGQANQGLQSQLQGIQASGLQSGFSNAQNEFNTQNQLGLSGLNTQLNAAGQLGTLGNNQYNQEAGIYNAQNTLGGEQQNLQQSQLNTNYQNFINQQNYPYAQLGYLSDILHGTSTSAGGSGVYANYSQPANVLGQVAGVGAGAAGLAGLFGSSAAA